MVGDVDHLRMLSAFMLSATTRQSVYWLRSTCETMCPNLIWHELAEPEGMHTNVIYYIDMHATGHGEGSV